MLKTMYENGDAVGDCFFIKDVASLILPSGRPKRRSLFRCQCGNEFESLMTNVNSGKTSGCQECKGAKISESKTTHGHAIKGHVTPEHRTWSLIKDRCNNKKHKHYNDYGGRGITVCDEWNNDYIKFFDDMGKKPSPKHSIDRIENNKGYYKENCRWATKKEQARNRRSNVMIEYKGEIKSLIEWTEIYNLSYDRTRQRLKRYKWPFEKIIHIN